MEAILRKSVMETRLLFKIHPAPFVLQTWMIPQILQLVEASKLHSNTLEIVVNTPLTTQNTLSAT